MRQGVISPRFIGLTALLAGLVAGCGPAGGGVRITPVPADQTLEATIVERDSAWISEKIAILDVEGLISNQADRGLLSSGENPVALTVEKLNAIARDPTVKAVVLRINSPGGTVTGSDILHAEIVRLKQTTKKPIVAVMMDLATSGGYYVACAADEIIAHPTTITGSIGVLMQMVTLTGTMSLLGVKAEAITSGPMKDAGSPFKDLQPEERKIFQEIVDRLYSRFVDAVVAGRPKLSRDKIVTLADGRIYTADQALEAGLIDRIGTLRDAIESAKKRAGLSRANVVIYNRPLGWRGSVYANAQNGEPPQTLLGFPNLNGRGIWTSTPVFLYLWRLE